MQMLQLLQIPLARVRLGDERGAIGWLAIGIIVGVLLVIGGVIKFLIPGE